MNDLFGFLFLLSILGLLCTLIKPSIGAFWLKVPSRKKGILPYSLAIILFFVLFGVTNTPLSSQQSGLKALETTDVPYYVNSDSIKQAFTNSVLTYSFSKNDEKSDTNVISIGFENPGSQDLLTNNHIELQYNPKNRTIYYATMYINLSDTIVTASEVDKLIHFANYFDRGAAEKYKTLLPKMLRVYPLEENGGEFTIAEKNIHFEISHNLTDIKLFRQQGRSVDLKSLNFYIAFSVSNLNQRFL